MKTTQDIDRQIEAIKIAIEVNQTWPDRHRVIPELKRKLERKVKERALHTDPIVPT